jgi:hypothetical protein
MSGVRIALAPRLFEVVLANPDALPRYDGKVLAEVSHTVATLCWDEPIPANLSSSVPGHDMFIGSIGQFVIETAQNAGLDPVVIAGTAYTDPRVLSYVRPTGDLAELAERDQALAGLREGIYTAVVLVHLLSLSKARRRPLPTSSVGD